MTALVKLNREQCPAYASLHADSFLTPADEIAVPRSPFYLEPLETGSRRILARGGLGVLVAKPGDVRYRAEVYGPPGPAPSSNAGTASRKERIAYRGVPAGARHQVHRGSFKADPIHYTGDPWVWVNYGSWKEYLPLHCLYYYSSLQGLEGLKGLEVKEPALPTQYHFLIVTRISNRNLTINLTGGR